MKIRAEILEVKNHGDTLVIRCQGKQAVAADWRPESEQILTVSSNDKNGRAFFVGRRITIEVNP